MAPLASPATRRTHILRKFGVNRDGEILPDVYVDFERIDQAKTLISHDNSDNPTSWRSMMGQGEHRRFKWLDDPNGEDFDPDGNQTRKSKKIKLCDPTVDGQNFEDPEEYVEIDVPERITFQGSRNNFQKGVEKLINSELNESRKVNPRRVRHRGTNIDDDASDAADANPELTQYVVNLWDGNKSAYDINDEDDDDDEYVEYDLIEQLGHEEMSTNNGQTRKEKLLNDYIVDITVEASLKEEGPGGKNPPYVLDPYTNIVNVSWGLGAVKFHDGAS